MKIIALILLTTFSFNIHAQTELPPNIPRIRWSPSPFYREEGFRLGYILRLEDLIFWRYAGRFMMGFGSSPQIMRDRECVDEFTNRLARERNSATREAVTDEMNQLCVIEDNPWLFSIVDPTLFAEAKNIGLIPVMIYYTRSTASLFGVLQTGRLRALVSDTLNYVHNVIPTNPNSPAPTFYSLERGELPIGKAVNPAIGFVDGRVVKASLDHLIRKSYEVTFQLGEVGNNFARFSVNTSGMFDHLVLAMLTGKSVRLGYVRLFRVHSWLSSIMSAYATNYRITSIEILSGGGPPVPPADSTGP